MATINYNGMELEEFKERKVFDAPFEMCVWNDNDGLPTVRFVCAVIPYRHVGQVITTSGAFEHCALLPDTPKPRRATNRELSRWLAQGNGQIQYDDKTKNFGKSPDGERHKALKSTTIFEYFGADDFYVGVDIQVRKWSDNEWHEPTVDYIRLEDVK